MSFASLFPLPHSYLLIASLIMGITSIVLCYYHKYNWALATLFFTAFVLRLFMAHLDPFLHEWDERYHALVARNMMHDPFKPMLRISDALGYNFKEWCCNHIWLHKQPLFLWQMALSMQVFGVSEFAIRYPAVLMGSLDILLVYRIAYLMTANKTIAFTSALLACFPYYHLELISGQYGMDQNDIAFDFYLLCSVWAYAEYLGKKSFKYAILIGLFAGCAVLNKWLTGMLVFSGWGIIVLSNIRKESFKTDVIHFVSAIFVCLIIFLPWQLYILHAFPVEAKYELELNRRHIWEAIEGHSGSNWYYLSMFNVYFGDYICWLLPFGIFFLFFRKKYLNELSFSILIFFTLFFSFFSFVAQTKVYAYFMAIAPFGYILMAVALYQFFSQPLAYKYLFIPGMLVVSMLIFNLAEITNKHDPGNKKNAWVNSAYNANIYRNLKTRIPANTKLAYTVKDQIEFMFFNNSIDAYNWTPNEQESNSLNRKHSPVVVFGYKTRGNLPEYLKKYDSLYIIPDDLR